MDKTNNYKKFLTSIHMGTVIFRYYKSKLKSETLNSEYQSFLNTFKNHEDLITEYLKTHDMQDASFITKSESMAIWMEKFILAFAKGDNDVLLRSVNAMHMATLSVLKFLRKNSQMDKEFLKIVQAILSDYDDITKRISQSLSSNIIDRTMLTN